MSEFIKNKVYYSIFDRSYKSSTHAYARYKTTDAAKLAEITNNISAIKKEFQCKDMLILQQVHGDVVIDADNMMDYDIEPEADAATTTKKDLILAIKTADCVPVILSSNDGTIIGAAHCGWRGAKANIIDKLATMMRNKGCKTIKALIGPAIRQDSYEVDENFYISFLKDNSSHNDFFIKSSLNIDRYMFDLPGFIRFKLRSSDVNDIVSIEEDTYSMFDKYPSFRRSSHTQEIYNQNILTTIAIK